VSKATIAPTPKEIEFAPILNIPPAPLKPSCNINTRHNATYEVLIPKNITRIAIPDACADVPPGNGRVSDIRIKLSAVSIPRYGMGICTNFFFICVILYISAIPAAPNVG